MTRSLRIFWLFVFIIIALPLSVFAQEDTNTFPTVDALNNANIPHRDLTELAQRLLGVGEIPPPPLTAEPLTAGIQRTFWVSGDDDTFQIDARLWVVGEHIYLWVENGAQVSKEDLQRLANDFDNLVYDQSRALWGNESNPGIDGDPRVHGLFAYDLGGGVAAYYAARHSYPTEAVESSNEGEFLFFNLDAVEPYMGTDYLTGVTAHEFQHMIRANVDGNEDGWMDEGMSTFTEHYLGYTDTYVAVAFLSNPDVQLNAWSEENFLRTTDYGAAFLWINYLHERLGDNVLGQISREPANGMVGVDRVLQAQGENDVETFFADWVLANLFIDPNSTVEGIYGYRTLSSLPSARMTTINLGKQALSINQYATNYLLLDNIPNATSLNIDLNMPTVARLIDTTAQNGAQFMYSNRGDDSNSYMTRTFDLTNVNSATLNYNVWFHIEEDWDYGYLMVSTDDGRTWTATQTDHMVTTNPFLNAYGPGYTGYSADITDSGWIRETVSLDAYAGKEIQLRFEMVYDDAVNQPGMAIDDIEIAEIGYSENFESGIGEWDAAGWIRTDNRLPQSVWLQAVQQVGRKNTVTRWRIEGSDIFVLPLEANVDNVILAVSPFSPTTTVPAEISLALDFE